MKTLALLIAFTLTSVAQAEVHDTYAKAYAAAAKDGKPLVVLISATAWCPPCRALHPTIERMKKDGSFDNVHFYYLDYDKETKLANNLDDKKKVPVFVKFTDVHKTATFLRGNKSKQQIIKFLGEKRYEFKFKQPPSRFKSL